jgi:hypothetical protein
LGSEDETRKLLNIREGMEERIARLQVEIDDLRKAVAEIDRHIVRLGFRQPTPTPVKPKASVEGDETEEGRISIKSKDGETLGSLRMSETEIVFEPRGDLSFTTAIPPFQSFFIERVLSNMRSADERRVTTGETSAEEVFSYDVETDGELILSVVIRNYGGERRLSEIRSSLRWTFDKMYEKLRQS